MPAITIESKKFPDGFPDETRLYVEWVAGEKTLRHNAFGPKGRKVYKHRNPVWEGIVSGQFTRNFDPGKYVWKAHKEDPAATDNFSELGSFLVDVDEKQWKQITNMEPKMQKPMMTSDGVVFTCQFPGCGKKTTSKVSAVLHESWEHYGVDLLENPEKKANVDAQVDKMNAKVRDRENAKATKARVRLQ